MYEMVGTKRQQKQFEKTWEYFCEEFGWVNDPYAETGLRYNIRVGKRSWHRRHKVIGTIELIPYDPDNPDSTVEGRFPFSAIEEISCNKQYTWEIDKLCIHRDFQRMGNFPTFLQILNDHAKQHDSLYYVALIEKKFFRMLRISYEGCFKQVGDELIGPTTSLVPAYADAHHIIRLYEKIVAPEQR